MAAERTTRLRIYVWESDGDEFTRAQMTASHQVLEDRVGQFFAGSTAPVINLDNPAERLARSLWLDTDDNVLYFFTTDNQWRALNAFAAPTTTLTPQTTPSNNEGSATTYARSDHSHAMLPFGVVGDVQRVSTAAAAGTLAKYARADHVHIIDDGAVNTSAKLADGIVTTAKIAAGNVTTDRISAGAVTKTRLAADQQLPSGLILPYAGAINVSLATSNPAGAGVPAGWLLCNGGLHNTADYPDLFALIGYAYGGSGTTFGVPNMTNRVAQGAGTTALGSTGGGTATLTEANLPSHTHSSGALVVGGDGAHSHTAASFSITNQGEHGHPVVSNPVAGIHDHGFAGRQVPYRSNSSPFFLQVVGDVGPFGLNLPYVLDTFDAAAILQSIANDTGRHAHSLPSQNISGGGHSHTVTGSTAATGSGAAFAVSSAHVGLHHLIKT